MKGRSKSLLAPISPQNVYQPEKIDAVYIRLDYLNPRISLHRPSDQHDILELQKRFSCGLIHSADPFLSCNLKPGNLKNPPQKYLLSWQGFPRYV